MGARLAKKHLTLNFWGDISIALMNEKIPLAKRIRKIQMNAEKLHHYPAWDYYEWVLHKSRYMKQCQKAGIPMIPTIFVDSGFDAKGLEGDPEAGLGQVLPQARLH